MERNKQVGNLLCVVAFFIVLGGIMGFHPQMEMINKVIGILMCAVIVGFLLSQLKDIIK